MLLHQFKSSPSGRHAGLAELLCEGRPRWEEILTRIAFPRMYRPRIKGHGLSRYPRSEVVAQFFGHIEMLDTVLIHQPWLTEDGPNLADISVAAQLHEIMRTSPLRGQIEEHTALLEWIRRIDARTCPDPGSAT